MVTLVVTDDNGETQTFTTTATGTTYSADVPVGLPEGHYSVTATVQDAAGNEASATDNNGVIDTNEAPNAENDGFSTEIYFNSEDAGYSNTLIAYEMIDGVATNPVVIIANTNTATASDVTPIATINGQYIQFILVAKGGTTHDGFVGKDLGFDENGKLTADGVIVESNVYYQDAALNSAGEDFFVETANGNGFVIGIEDVPSIDGGDNDFNDLIITTKQLPSFVTDEDTAITIDVLNNDSDPDGDALSITHVQGHDFSKDGPVATVTNDAGTDIGTVEIQVIDGVQKIRFTPDPSLQSMAEGELLSVKFDYSITDDNGGTASAYVQITVHGTNDPTLTKEDDNQTKEDITLTVAADQGVLSNDSDVDNVLTVAIFTVANDATSYNAGSSATIAGKGELTLNSDGSYEFVPVANYSGTIPEVTYTTNTGVTETLTLSVTPVADSIDASNFTAEVGTVNIVDVVLGDTSNAVITTDDGHSSGNITQIEYPDGTTITPGGDNYLYTSGGQGLGIGTGGDFRIDEGDVLLVNLPTYVSDLGLVFKNAAGQTITFTMQNIDGTTTVQTYTFANNANAESTMTLNSDKPFGEFSFVVTGDSQGGNGSTLIGLTTTGIVQSTYSYPLELVYGFTDTDGSESIGTITLSGFPVGTDVNIYEGDNDGQVELVDNDDGTWSIDVGAFAQNGATFSLTDLVIQTDIELPVGFDPRLELTIMDGTDSSISILGGSESELLQGSDGNDLLHGESGDDELNGGLGNDILIGGLGDDILVGSEGADTFVWLEGDSGTDHVKDFDFSEGDVLDLSDLLQISIGENLDDYLDFTSDGTNTTIDIHENGDSSAITQTIMLDGVDLGSDDVTIINDMLTGDHQGSLFIGDNISVDSVTMDVIPDDIP